MTGHVMPAFPHTLIGLGPFADLGCKIVFTKSSVTVYHPDGHPLLSDNWTTPLALPAHRGSRTDGLR